MPSELEGAKDMLKAKALELTEGAPVKTHLVQTYWNKWITMGEVVVDLQCTYQNVELHFKQFRYRGIKVDWRVVKNRVEWKIGPEGV